jgi:arsenite methyltransferase
MHEANVVSEFYGTTIKKTEDLQFDACCVAEYDLELLKPITDEVKEKRYGCGSPLPEAVESKTILDLGCGAGIDVFMAAQLVGPRGKVIGVDMTDAQLEVARKNVAPIMANLGYEKANVEFKKGRIEEIPAEDDSIDVVISNCVINLCPNKELVFGEIRRILKPGGEFLIADIVADRRIPEHLAQDERLYSECMTGAAYAGDLRRTMQAAGFEDVRTVNSRRLGDVIEGIHFDSVALRGFKISLEDACEDFGQVAVYKGTIARHSDSFILDQGHQFVAGIPQRVCKNTADMITQTRYAPHFDVSPTMFHMGLFDCGPKEGNSPAASPGLAPTSACC